MATLSQRGTKLHRDLDWLSESGVFYNFQKAQSEASLIISVLSKV